MVVHRHREVTLCLVLTDDVLVEKSLDFRRLGQVRQVQSLHFGVLCLVLIHLLNHLMPRLYAVLTYICPVLALEHLRHGATAERADSLFFLLCCHIIGGVLLIPRLT